MPTKKTIALNQNESAILASAFGRNSKTHSLIDMIIADNDLPELSESEIMKHAAIVEGGLRSEIYTRKALRILHGSGLSVKMAAVGWPLIVRYIMNNPQPIDFIKLNKYIIVKSGGTSKVTEDIIADNNVVAYLLCTAMDIKVTNEQIATELLDDLCKWNDHVQKKKSVLANQNYTDEVKSRIKALRKLLKINNSSALAPSEGTTSISQQIFNTEAMVSSLVFEDISLRSKDIDEVLLSFIVPIEQFQMDHPLDAITIKAFTDHIRTALDLKLMVKAYKQAKTDFFALNPERWQSKALSAVNRLRESEKQLNSSKNTLIQLESELDEVNRHAKRLEIDIENLKINNNELISLRDLFFNLGNETEDEDPEENIDIEILQKQNTIFVGGHQNLQRKLRNLFPKWKYISSESFDPALFEYAEVVYIHPTACSHGLYYKVLSAVDRSKIKYLSKTNLNSVLREMRL